MEWEPAPRPPFTAHTHARQDSASARGFRNSRPRLPAAAGVALALAPMLLAALLLWSHVDAGALPPGLPPRPLPAGAASTKTPAFLQALTPAFLQVLPLNDPADRLRDAGRCMAGAERVEDCVPFLHSALAANGRNTQAALWLSQIALHRADRAEATRWLSYALQRDRSFPVLWTVWQAATLENLPVPAAPQDEDLLRTAPPGYRAHYPFLLARGWTEPRVFSFLLRHGSPAQSQEYLQSLVDSRNPAAIPLLRHIIEQPPPPGSPQFSCASLLRQTVRHAVRGERNLAEVSALWQSALSRRSPACSPSGDLLPDKRVSSDQDGLWNYNPALRLPLLPLSFDWSVAQRRNVLVTPLNRHSGGIRIAVHAPVNEPLVLLARTLPPPGDASAVLIRARGQLNAPPACRETLHWEIRNRAGNHTFHRTPLALPHGVLQPPDERLEVALRLPLPTGNEPLQLILAQHPHPHSECPGVSLDLASIHVDPAGLQPPAAAPPTRDPIDALHRSP